MSDRRTAEDPLLGSVLEGRYRVERHAGSGGHGVVYQGLHLTLGVPVAIKIVASASEAAFGRLANEAKILVKLRHPNIASSLDLGVVETGSGRAPYLVMDWCAGESLASVLRARGEGVSVERAFEIVDALAGAVAHAHESGIVHRDIKPSNVMMTPSSSGDAVPRLIDFGIAKLVEEGAEPGSGKTRSVGGRSAFTMGYAAPEQIAGGRTGPWTDVHALGLLFTELVTGGQPYEGAEAPDLAAIDPDRPTPGRLGIDVGPLEAVIARALALRPSDRYRDGGTLQKALRDAWTTRTAGAARPARRAPTPATTSAGRTAPLSSLRAESTKPSRARRAIPWAVVAVVLLLGSAIGVALARRKEAARKASAPSASVSAAPAASAVVASNSSPCDVSDEELKKRAAQAGWSVDSVVAATDSRTFTLSRTTPTEVLLAQWFCDTIRFLEIRKDPAERARVMREQIATMRYPTSALAYGARDLCLIRLVGPRSNETIALFDALAPGVSWDIAGNTMSGPDPARSP